MSRLFVSRPVFEGAMAFHRKAGEACYFPLHRHEATMEILFIAEGEADYWIDGKHCTARAGDIVLFHPGVWHEERSRVETAFSFYYAGFHSLKLEGLPKNNIYSDHEEPVFSMDAHYDRMKRLYQDLCEEVRDGWPEALTTAGLLLELIIMEVHRTKAYPGPSGKPRLSTQSAVTRARRYIEERYHEPLTIRQIADHVYLSPSHLSHLFRDTFCESPIQYAIRQRVHAACRYLATTDWPVEHIASLVGYESVTAFQNMFKKASGQSPVAYRKAAKG